MLLLYTKETHRSKPSRQRSICKFSYWTHNAGRTPLLILVDSWIIGEWFRRQAVFLPLDLRKIQLKARGTGRGLLNQITRIEHSGPESVLIDQRTDRIRLRLRFRLASQKQRTAGNRRDARSDQDRKLGMLQIRC